MPARGRAAGALRRSRVVGVASDETRETRIAETIRDLAAVYERVKEHVVAVAAFRNAQPDRVTNSDAELDTDVDARGHSKDLVNDLVLLRRILNRAADHPDVVAKLPPSSMEKAEVTIRSSLNVAAIVRGATVPTYEELQAAAANEDQLMWADQYERLSTFYDRAQELLNKVQAASERRDERGMLLGITEMDDFIEDLDRDADILGRPKTVELRQGIASNRDQLASALSDASSTGHVIARRWTTDDDA